jgi:HSP20 family protein
MTFLSVKPQTRRFSNWFDHFDSEFPFHPADAVRTRIPVNTKETKDSYQVEIAAPGFHKDNFKLQVQEQTLTISAENSENKTDENEKYTRKEYNYDGFERSFTLPKTVDTEKITAEYKDGILHVTLPKMEESKSKGTIDIKIS